MSALEQIHCPRCGRWCAETDASRLRVICKCGVNVVLAGRQGGKLVVLAVAKPRPARIR